MKKLRWKLVITEPLDELILYNSATDAGFPINLTIEFFRIDSYRFYRTYRITRKLFLVIFIFKITKISILQNIQIL